MSELNARRARAQAMRLVTPEETPGEPPSVPARPAARGPLSRRGLVALVMLIGAVWRLFLMSRYAGWEESDYGNLAMIRGVLDARFMHYDMSHLPGYYALAALVLAVVGDTVVAAKGTSFVCGVLALGLAVALTDRLWGRAAAALAGVLLIFQPEFALYAASSLREPVYALAVMGCVGALAGERMVLAGVAASAAFLVRMDGAVALVPFMALHALGRIPRAGRLLAAMIPLGLTMFAWAAYCTVDHETWIFWGHAVEVNLQTGLGAEAVSRAEWLENGLIVAGGLAVLVLPGRIGWVVWGGLIVGVARAPWRAHGPRRTWSLAALTVGGTWAGMGLVAQHHWDHNLYWKWLHGVIPVVVPVGVVGLLRLAGGLGARLGPRARTALIGLALGQALVAELLETRRQVDLSQQLYAPQVALARWIEAEVPESTPMILDNIPQCWINRVDNERPMTSWMDLPELDGSPGAFAAWLQSHRVQYVLWFREDWTEASRVAPFLASGGHWEDEGVALDEVAREDGYGWIFYVVTLPGQPRPPAPSLSR